MPRASRSNNRARAPGIGLDIVEIGRIRAVARRSPRFLARVFSPEEIRYCQGKRRAWQHFAVRFAAKEAVWKALGDGRLALRDISVSRDPDGRPGVLLKGKPARGIQLSLTHSDHYAAAVALRLGR
ncbi:MAG: holo-ACP synthase [Elusimicrobia bacterium]|nr:holo-ACP synthase [Elusimicrobiota bacterium]